MARDATIHLNIAILQYFLSQYNTRLVKDIDTLHTASARDNLNTKLTKLN